ncbi:MAG: DUF402 domain-containing protein [Candidatus Saliniplasma sp.]
MVLVRYLRPDGEPREWEQTLLADRENVIVSTFRFHLEKPFSPFDSCILIRDGYYGVMFDLLDRWYNVVKIYGYKKKLVGYYSDIRTPPKSIKGGYKAVDLFLDFWVDLDGSYIILDLDEFQVANLSKDMEKHAKDAAKQLKDMIEKDSYPPKIVKSFNISADEIGV